MLTPDNIRQIVNNITKKIDEKNDLYNKRNNSIKKNKNPETRYSDISLEENNSIYWYNYSITELRDTTEMLREIEKLKTALLNMKNIEEQINKQEEKYLRDLSQLRLSYGLEALVRHKIKNQSKKNTDIINQKINSDPNSEILREFVFNKGYGEKKEPIDTDQTNPIGQPDSTNPTGQPDSTNPIGGKLKSTQRYKPRPTRRYKPRPTRRYKLKKIQTKK